MGLTRFFLNFLSIKLLSDIHYSSCLPPPPQPWSGVPKPLLRLFLVMKVTIWNIKCQLVKETNITKMAKNHVGNSYIEHWHQHWSNAASFRITRSGHLYWNYPMLTILLFHLTLLNVRNKMLYIYGTLLQCICEINNSEKTLANLTKLPDT